jgi:hypoxanthine-DNA glycosylase
MNEISSFAPIIDDDSNVLILGSIPGIESLRKNEYYGHPRNAFWHIIFDLLIEEYISDYTAKIALVKRHHIALWDVIGDCVRKGSLDSNIKNAQPNDFEALYNRYPNIKYIYFNGNKAYDIYMRKVGLSKFKQYSKLPSTSPAHAIKYEKKLAQWQQIIL